MSVVLGGTWVTPAVTRVREFASSTAAVLVMSGRPGCGKSVAACLWLLEGRYRPKAVASRSDHVWDQEVLRKVSRRWVSAVDLARAGSFGDAVEDTWRPAEKAELLVVDDLGQEMLDTKGWALGNMVALLCRRFDEGLRTVVTTNMCGADWKARYCSSDGGRLADRLAQGGEFWETSSSSLRRQSPGGMP